MAGTQQTIPGDGVARPVIPLQNTEEPAIEVIEEDSSPVQRQDFPHAADDTERAGQHESAEDDDAPQAGGGEDSRVAHAQQGGQVEALPGETQEQLTARQRRRNRERDARNRERAELIRLRQENLQLRQGQQQIDSRLTNVEKTGLDAQIGSLEMELQRANLVMQRAMEAQNGEDFVRAQEIRDTFRDRLNALKQQKGQLPQQRQGGQVQGAPQQGAPPGLTQAQISYARIFASRHPWYRSQNPDKDSLMVQQIDNEMMAEGMNPTLPDYWIELERRVQEDMPHKFQAANDAADKGPGSQPRQQQQNRGNVGNGRTGGPRLPGAGNGGGGGSGGAPLKFHLSKERKQSLIDLGVYGTPDQDKYIRSFIRWDKEHPDGK